MPFVRTVTGDVDPSAIGITSMHEHILIDARTNYEDPTNVPTIGPLDPAAPVSIELLAALRRDPRVLKDNLVLDDEELAVKELMEFKSGGGDCVVDVTNVGLHPQPAGLRRIATRTGLHIVAGCGFYVERSHPAYVETESIDELASRIALSIHRGINETDVQAGIIGEIGTSTLTPQEHKVLRACAMAHMMTGAAISIHSSSFCRVGEKIVKLLTTEGVPPNRIIMGHMDENMIDISAPPNLAYLDYHRRVLDLGAWVQYDTFGSEWYWDGVGDREPSDSERSAGLAALVADGYGDQLLVAQDVFVKTCLKRYGGAGYGHLVTAVPDMLGKAGIPDDAITRILIDNPRRALAIPDRFAMA